jgi:hypothetical protein
MSNKRRKITLSKNRLDPLSRWYFSKIKFGDAFGNRTVNPIVTDGRLFVSDRQPGLLEEEPHVTWDLAGTNINGEPNEPTVQNLREFVTAALADDIGRFLEFTQGNNQYIFTEKAVGNREERYSSFSAEILNSLLLTAAYGLRESYRDGSRLFQELSQYSIRNINGRIATNRTFSSFIDALRQSQIRVGNNRLGVEFNVLYSALEQGVNDGVRELSVLSIPTVLAAYVPIILAKEDATNQQKSLAQYFIFTEIAKIVPDNVIKEAVLANNDYNFRHHYSEIETPYVSTRNSSNFLEEVSTGEPYRAGIKSDYSYFIRGYEENTQTQDIPETILPNNYIRNYYKDIARRRERGGLGLGAEEKYQEYRNILSLSGEIKQEALDGIYETFYYNSYGVEVQDLGISDDEFFVIDSKNRSIILDSSQVAEGALEGGFPPMEVGVEFTRGSFGSYQEILADEDEFGILDISSVLFENANNAGNNEFRSSILYSTEYLANINNNIEERESPFAIANLREFQLGSLITSPSGRDEFDINSLVLTTNSNLIPSIDDVEIALEALQMRANRNSNRSYGAIISGEDSRNESLGYRITKVAQSNNLRQDFYIANGLGDKVITYKDAQIKYGQEYDYTLSEYRLVFGTKYKFRVVSPDLPLWIMENYLGLANNAEERIREIGAGQVIDPFNPPPQPQEIPAIPNITFNAYIQEAADPTITEVPIYDENFNTQNVFNILPEEDFARLVTSNVGGQGAISYPRAKVLDRPPTAPILDVFPMVGIKDQIKLGVNLQTGNNTGTANSREIVSIGDMTDKIIELKNYQDTYVNRFLAPNRLEYKNEGLSELRNIILYRTTDIDLDVENYNDIYKSFNPETNPLVSVRRFTDQSLESEEFADVVQIPSYELRDTIQPNTNYYYTCIVEDFHGNPSNPSIIYRVRLLFDKGLLIPEIDTVNPMGESNKKPQKNLARYMQIDASNIQTLPYVNTGEEGFTTERSLGYSLGKSIEDQSYIVRLTSKDTGRKFDVKLNFVVRVDGAPINEGT